VTAFDEVLSKSWEEELIIRAESLGYLPKKEDPFCDGDMCDIDFQATGSVTGAALLIAGSALGGGMLAVPQATAGAGAIPSIAALIGMWAFLLIEGLLLVEVNVAVATWLEVSLPPRTHHHTTISTAISPCTLITHSLYLFSIYAGAWILMLCVCVCVCVCACLCVVVSEALCQHAILSSHHVGEVAGQHRGRLLSVVLQCGVDISDSARGRHPE
jgi:hypothetical protein